MRDGGEPSFDFDQSYITRGGAESDLAPITP